MPSLLEKLRRRGPFFALLPAIIAIGCTAPKLYLEARAAGLVGSQQLVGARIVAKYRVTPDRLADDGCRIDVDIGGQIQKEGIACASWANLNRGDIVQRADAWTVYIDPDNALTHTVVDLVILAILTMLTVILFKSRSLVGWLEDQAEITP